MRRGVLSSTLLLVGFSVGLSGGQRSIDAALVAEIARIRAIDNHSHGEPALPPGNESENPVDPSVELRWSPFRFPVRLRVDSPEYAEAWQALWGAFPAGPDLPRATLRAKWQVRREKAEAYPAWVLDQAGIELALINAERLGPGQLPPRFRWVPETSVLLFPLESQQPPPFQQILKESGLSVLPASLAEYVSRVVTPTFERWKAGGAIAVKFGVAYRRPLDFGQVAREDAARTYASSVAGAAPAAGEYKALQDYLFRTMCAEAGRLGLVVHIHTGAGARPYFDLAGSRPLLLEPTLNDPALRQTRFVLVHGGWPFEKETGAMLMKPNVYADFSAQTFLRSTHALAEMLREWLEWYPEKVLFGSDAYSDPPAGVATPLADWEEKTWLSARTSRDALARALSDMLSDRQITHAQALDLARLVLRGNAERLYGLGPGEK